MFSLLSSLDFIGAACALIATICFVRVNVLGWPVSILACSIESYLFLARGIYAGAGLSVVYFFMMFYGWYQWKHGGANKTELAIADISYKQAMRMVLIAIPVYIIISLVLRFYTDSNIPYWDAFTTVLGFGAQWLGARKIIQNWYCWIVVDGINMGIYFYQGIPMHAILQVIYLIMAFAGLYYWMKKKAALFTDAELSEN